MRTTFIVGFPGETDAEFEELVDFVAGSAVRARAASSPIRSSPARRAAKLDGHCPKRSRRGAAIA